MFKNRNSRWFVLLAALMLTVTLACRFGISLGDERPGDERSDEPPSVQSDGEVNRTVKGMAEDFNFSLDRTEVSSGTVTFVIQNDGHMPHDFALRGEGVEEKTSLIDPGDTETLTVDLEPGVYTYICTVPGHDLLGMQGTLTVK